MKAGWLALAAFAAGCTTVPLPEIAGRASPPGWTGATAAADAPAPPPRWWEGFGDPVLSRLAVRAGDTDDVALAEARLSEAQAQLRVARAALRPSVGLSGNAATATAGGFDQDTLSAAVDARIDLDLAGSARLRRTAALSRADAAAARRDAARIASRAAAVRLYVAYREGEARALAGDRSVRSFADLVAISGSRNRAGLVSALDVASAEAALQAARARPLAAREASAAARLGLEALLGLPPGALAEALAAPRPVPVGDAPAALETPVAVVARRPDLRATELELAATGFDAEAARRDFLPNITLGTAIGGQLVASASPFTASGLLAQLLGSLTAPVFSAGRLEGARDAADARRAAAAATYRAAVSEALSEVETALVSVRAAGGRERAQEAARRAAGDQAALARARYVGGLANFTDVLVAERASFDAEAEGATARADGARALTALYAALGAGADAAPAGSAAGAP